MSAMISNPSALGDTIEESELPDSVVTDSRTPAVIDLCHEYGVKPGDEITAKLQEAINELSALGGGWVYIPKPGTYKLNGEVISGEVEEGSYAGQILFPANNFAQPKIVLGIKGGSPTAGGNMSEWSGVILESNAASGNIFDAIPGTNGKTYLNRPGTNVEVVMNDLTVKAPNNPQCGGVNLWNIARCELDRLVIGSGVGVEPTGSGRALTLPRVSNAGKVVLGTVSLYNFPIGLGLTEHTFGRHVEIRGMLTAIETLGLAHANHFAYLDVEGCAVVIARHPTLGGTYINGFLDWEGLGEGDRAPGLFIKDLASGVGQLKGDLTVHFAKSSLATESSAGVPAIGGEGLNISSLLESGGDGWKNRFVRDTFSRRYALGEGAPGLASHTMHPWIIRSGTFNLTQKVDYGELRGTAGSEAQVTLPTRGGCSRVIHASILTAAEFNPTKIIVGRAVGGTFNDKRLEVVFQAASTRILLNGTKIGESAIKLSANASNDVTVTVVYGAAGKPETITVWIGTTEALSLTLTAEQQATLGPGTENYFPYNDGLRLEDTNTAFTNFEVESL